MAWGNFVSSALGIRFPILFSLWLSPAFATSKVLFIGDSHSAQSVGDAIRESLIESEVVHNSDWIQYSIAGSSMSHWLDGNFSGLKYGYVYKENGPEVYRRSGSPEKRIGRFSTLLEHYKSPLSRHQEVVILLGTNDIHSFSADVKKHPKENPLDLLRPYLHHTQQIVRQIGSSMGCTWILVPSARKFSPELFTLFTKEMIGVLEKEKCRVVDVRHLELSFPGQVPASLIEPNHMDGIHFLFEMGRALGLHISQQLRNFF